MCLNARLIDISYPFALVLPSATGTILEAETQPHTDRFEALRRAEAYNRRPPWIDGRLAWMIAVEVDAISLPDIEVVWLQGEGGTFEARIGIAFRFISPTLEEEELLRLGRAVSLN